MPRRLPVRSLPIISSNGSDAPLPSKYRYLAVAAHIRVAQPCIAAFGNELLLAAYGATCCAITCSLAFCAGWISVRSWVLLVASALCLSTAGLMVGRAMRGADAKRVHDDEIGEHHGLVAEVSGTAGDDGVLVVRRGPTGRRGSPQANSFPGDPVAGGYESAHDDSRESARRANSQGC